MHDAVERCSQCFASPMPEGTCGRHCAAAACAAELVWHSRPGLTWTSKRNAGGLTAADRCHTVLATYDSGALT
jgi:hypothetical protein